MKKQNKKTFTIQNITTGRLNALVNNIMRQTGIESPEEAVRLMNAGKISVSLMIPLPRWSIENGAIHFSVVSKGETGEELQARYENNYAAMSYRISPDVQEILPRVTKTYNRRVEVVILRGELFSNDGRTTKNIRLEATGRGLRKPSAEIAWLIREQFSDQDLKDMDLNEIVVMHQPFDEEQGYQVYLSARQGETLSLQRDSLRHVWNCHERYKVGFAFLL